ncbi:hypothetical protein [Bacillus sp. 1P06AnD]|uniref:hypothetical protein n=1 Tax=Bacillus sp. 1P06AnD TaxID=3132208 RepID=UPI00399F0A7A
MDLLETVKEAAVILMVFCTFIFYLKLRKLKHHRTLSAFEYIMYVITQLAYILWAGSYLLTIIN